MDARDLLPPWEIRLGRSGYSGCAGMAEVSARVAAHWTDVWYRAHRERITREYLAPFGFRPAPDPAPPTWAFVPAGEHGYAEYVAEGTELGDGTTSRFDLDAAVLEDRDPRPTLERLERAFGALMADGRCRCQLGDPTAGDPLGAAP